jgi:predicted transcriptional regulator
MMARFSHDVTEAELAVLQRLWEHGPSSRRQLAEALYPGRGTVAYTTVQKLLERLQSKGCVKPHKSAGPRAFVAAVSREDLMSRHLLDLADTFGDGSLAPLISNLVRARPLTTGQLQDLRNLLDGLLRQSPSREPRR